MSRRAVTAAAVALLTGAAVLAASPTAQAVAAGSCKVSANVSITPGLTLSPAKIATSTLSGTVNGCTGPIAPTATATVTGTVRSVAPGQTCTTGTGKGTLTVRWANGAVSKISITQKPNPATPTLFDQIIAGKVTSGPGLAQGAKIRSVVTLTPTTGNCVTTALTAATLAGKINITTP